MKNWIIAGLLVAAGIVPLAGQEPDLSKAPRVPMAEFKALQAAGTVLVVDVRDEVSFSTGHIPGARSIPLGQLLDPRRVAELKATRKPIVLYCAWHEEHTSARGVLMLAGAGIKSRALLGGWNQWVSDGGAVATGSK